MIRQSLKKWAGKTYRAYRKWRSQNAGILCYVRSSDAIRVLLARRVGSSRNRFFSGGGRWGGSGGGVNAGESLWEAAIRETIEEFGDHPVLGRALQKFGGDVPMHWNAGFPLYHFEVFLLELEEMPGQWPTPHAADGHEWDRFGWFSLKELPRPLLPGLSSLERRLELLEAEK